MGNNMAAMRNRIAEMRNSIAEKTRCETVSSSEQGGQPTVMKILILQYFTTGNGLWAPNHNNFTLREKNIPHGPISLHYSNFHSRV
jgi:hypothetical protein